MKLTLGSLHPVAVELVRMYNERGTHNMINVDIINAHEYARRGLAGERIGAAQSRQVYLAWEALRWQNHNHAAAQAADLELLTKIYS